MSGKTKAEIWRAFTPAEKLDVREIVELFNATLYAETGPKGVIPFKPVPWTNRGYWTYALR